MTSVRIAAAQLTAQVHRDLDARWREIEASVAQAAAAGAALVVLPECVTTGYDVTPAVLERWSAAGGEEEGRERLTALAREHEIAIVYGHVAREGDGWVNASTFLDERGERLAEYRKTHFFPGVDTECFRAGDALSPVVQWHGVGVGMAICFDVEFPEVVRSLALAGADLVCVPTANMREFPQVSQVLVPARAIENGITVAYANYCGQDGRYDYGGLSVIALADASRELASVDAPALVVSEVPVAQPERGIGDGPTGTYLRDLRPSLYRSAS